MKIQDYPSRPTYQELLEAETVPVPACLKPSKIGPTPQSSISAEIWTSRKTFDLEVEYLWPKVWQMVCRETALKKTGDYYVYNIARYSILLVHNENGQIKGFHNSCLHRGRALKTGRGNSRELRCPYHGFCWRLDGSFKEAYCERDFKHIDLQQLSLPEVKVSKWGGWIFINMDSEAPSFEEYSPILREHFSRWKPEDRYVSLHLEKKIRCNWKVALEAFIESYHSIQTHPQILSFTGGDNSQYDIFNDHLSRTITPQGIPNPSHKNQFSVRQIVEGMIGSPGFDRALRILGLPTDKISSRTAIAAIRRAELAEVLEPNVLAKATDSEIMDSILYLLFPNFAPWGGFQSQLTYRYRPNGLDHESCIMDIYILDSFSGDRARPPDAQKKSLDFHEDYNELSQLGALGPIFDQDVKNLAEVQRGLNASHTKKTITATYQESRIRHFHNTLGKYINKHPLAPEG